MRFGEVETALILAAYGESFRQPGRFASSGELLDRYVIEPAEGWIHQIVSDLGKRGLIYGKGVMGDERSQPIRLTAAGMKFAEDLIDRRQVVHERQVQPASTALAEAPASDRIVQFDHNSAGYANISVALSDLEQFVRESNSLEIDSGERDRIARSLNSASTLWAAYQLKTLQIRVGILMTVQDAAVALASTAKAVAAALLVDTIKAFVKTHTGIDLDHV